MPATTPTASVHAIIHEATEIIRSALAELDAAHAAEVAALRAANAALRDDRDKALARLDRALDAIRSLEAAAPR